MSNHAALKVRRARPPSKSEVGMHRWYGYDDAANGRPFRQGYDTWHRAYQVSYERGRHTAAYLMGKYGYLPRWKQTQLLATALQKDGVPPTELLQFTSKYAPYTERE